MRLEKTINLDENRAATIKELRVKDIRHLVSQFSTLSAVPMQDLLGERFAEANELLKDCITLPEGETLEDLTGSEIELISEAFLDVNTAFLKLIAGAGKLASANSIPLTGSTAQQSP
jgi:hypothetical protein